MEYFPWNDEMIIFSHFGEPTKKWPENVQNSLNSWKTAVFGFLVNK